MNWKSLIAAAIIPLLTAACIQVNLPDKQQKKNTVHYALDLPADFKIPNQPVAVAEFSSNTPAKFRMLSRKGTELNQDPFAKWTQTPSYLLTFAFRDLYGCDDGADENSVYLLEGDLYTFERNLDTGTADLKVLYRLINRKTKDVVFSKLQNTAEPLKGTSSADFAEAMSKAVVKQAGVIRELIETETRKPSSSRKESAAK